jgi:N-acetylmuramoyl-L-alanine amidase
MIDSSGFSRVRVVAVAAVLAATALVVSSVSSGPATAASGSDAPSRAATAPVEQPAPPQGAFRTIVIDPGHGGREIGAVGPSGLTEKELTLDIATRLGNMIVQRLGLDVRLTRDSDIDKELEERTAFANNLKADVFISIHANSYRGRGVRGAETFFLSDRATDDAARRVAAIENDALELQGPASGDDGLQMLLWDMAQTAHLQESAVLAEMIQANLNSLGGTTDRGIKQAPFRVLKGANMPAVLVEVGFLSNPDEERMLADPAYRQRIAEVLFSSLSEYRRRQAMLLGGGDNH